MTDIGLGIIDKRTIIIVLFSMIIAQVLLQFQIPVDTTNAGNLFIDLILLTGYIYLVRSAYRLPFALLGSLSIVRKRETGLSKNWPELIAEVLHLISIFGEWEELELTDLDTDRRMPFVDESLEYSLLKWIPILGIMDRIGLIAISVLATIPTFNLTVKTIGIIGLIVMSTIFVLRGDFTALLKDTLDKDKKSDKEVEYLNVKNSKSEPIYVEVINKVETTVEQLDQEKPLWVEIGHFPEVSTSNPLPVKVYNDHLHVEVDNVVMTESNE